MTFGPRVPSTGPVPSRIFILAEAPGTEESESLTPLVGPSGRELRRMLRTIGVSLDDCYRANVFSHQPANNNLALYGTPSPSPAARSLGALTLNPITYIDDRWMPELDRIRAELIAVNPNVVIALGNTACWALLGQQGINNLRGSVHVSHFTGRDLKVVPTYHPAAVLRQWDQRVIALADLEKAHVESRSPEFTYDNTELWLAPTLDDLGTFGAQYLDHATVCATDVETKRGQITCVSFSPRPDYSITVPFWIDGPDPNYWSEHDEITARRWVNRWLSKPDLVKVMQNGLYDIQYFLREGYTLANCTEDTMLAHHSLYSELKKGLGFLGSVYANVPSWKHMRTFAKEEQLKRDD